MFDDNVEKVKEVVHENRRVGTREIVEDRLHTFWLIFWVWSVLMPPRTKRRESLQNEMLDNVGEDPALIKRIITITGDEMRR